MFASIKLLCLSVYISTIAYFTVAVDLSSSLKMAQCRAHCLNKFSDTSDKTCKGNSDCYNGCWQTCEKLSINYPIWSFNCGQHATRCNAGCQSACQFLTSRKEDTVVPLSPYKSRLTLIFSGISARWSLIWGAEVPSQKAVFALFTRSSGKPWKLRVQTAEEGAILDDVVTGTELKLVAVAESGLLSVIITPFEPSNNKKGLNNESHRGSEEEYPWNKDSIVRGDKEKGWPLLYQASVQESGLVATKVWWSTQRPFGSDYLVTWEVAGGGLKGHLYTDLPEVDLKLWPSTVYKVQVEVVSGPLGEPRISQLLILDTNNITATVVQSQKIEQLKEEPSIKLIEDPKIQLEVIVGVALGALLAFVVVIALICRRRRHSRSTFNDSSSSNSKLTLNRSITDLNVEDTLVRSKGDLLEPSPKLPSKSYSIYSVPYPAMESQNTLGIPSSQNVYINIHSSSLRNHNLKPHVSII